jgi:CRP-like cAMP-binding protein
MVFTTGECIFRAGDDAQSMYIISEGTVRIQIEGKNDITLVAG